MDTLKKNEIYTAEIDGFTSEALGVAHIASRAVFVRGALPGETWRIRIVKVTKSVCYGRGEELLSGAPVRRAPECPVYGRCGGCACMHMSYAAELEFKRRKVDDALRRVGGLDIAVDGIIGSDAALGYRNKAVFAVGGGSEPVFGFFRAGTHEVVPVEGCLLQSEAANACARAVTGWMRANGVPAYDEASGAGLIRHVFVRTSRAGGAVCCVVTAGGLGPRTDSLAAALRAACPGLTGVVLCVNKSRGNTVLAGSFYTLWGEAEMTDSLCGSVFSIAPQAFYQVNPPQAERLYSRAVELALPELGGTVFELYCGAGTISLSLARRAGRVVGAEIVPEAVENARENARRNGVENVEFICADAAEAAERFRGRGESSDVIVVDPPRKGMSAAAVRECAAMSPERIVYVSCDPATLARDAKLFKEYGYSPASATAVDMFPRTSHVETVVLLSKLNTKQHIEVDLNLDELDLTAAESKATYDEIKAYVLEKYGLKVSSLYISQVKRKCGLDVGQNYNLSKKEDAKVPQCPPEKEAAIMDALKHFQMI